MSGELDESSLFQLPHWVGLRIAELGVSCPEIWIHRTIPALNDQSVLETVRQPDGETRLHEYFAKVASRFWCSFNAG